MKYYLAIDLGATSGRHVVGFQENGEIILKEIHRFKTQMDDSPDGLVWDIPRIFQEIKNGIKKAFESYPELESIAIDTWGVDYVLMDGDKEIPPYYAYRNERCAKSAQKANEIVRFAEIYERTGIQFAPFNTLYQLYDDLGKGRLEKASDYLMLPSYFTYKLTGVKTHEFTNESTGSLLNPFTGEYDAILLKKFGLQRSYIGLDYFDASINRVAALIIGARNMEKALLKALLTPWHLLKEAQDSYDHTRVLALQEELKTLPWGEVWDEYLKLQGMVGDAEMFVQVREYEKEVLAKR
ncbi:MAG: L-rhamnose isomerase [Bacilli bacterium]|nr:L-rhamnose isomerase [Bacilli bacterium]